MQSSGTFVIQVPGPLTLGSHEFRVDMIDQYGDLSKPSDPVTIVVASLPAPIVRRTTLKTSSGFIRSITLYFSEAMTKQLTNNRNNYVLTDAGRFHVFGAKGNFRITLTSASYSSSNNSVTLAIAGTVRDARLATARAECAATGRIAGRMVVSCAKPRMERLVRIPSSTLVRHRSSPRRRSRPRTG